MLPKKPQETNTTPPPPPKKKKEKKSYPPSLLQKEDMSQKVWLDKGSILHKRSSALKCDGFPVPTFVL